MPAFADITEFIEPLTLTIRGRQYPVEPLTFEVGLSLQARLDPEAEDRLTGEEFCRTFLGATYDAMRADQVPEVYIVRAALTALADYQGGRTVAETMWRTGGDPKAVREDLERRLAEQQDSTPSRNTAGANRTQRRASTKATTSPPTS